MESSALTFWRQGAETVNREAKRNFGFVLVETTNQPIERDPDIPKKTLKSRVLLSG